MHTPSICDVLREQHRHRQDMHRAEIALTLQIKSICRRLTSGEKVQASLLYEAVIHSKPHPLATVATIVTKPFRDAREIIHLRRSEIEKSMTSQARMLPVWPRVMATRGFGALSLASLVGETGDLTNYSTHNKLWKRLGLAVINGERQRRLTGAAAIEHGYCPSRRAVMWNIGQLMFRAQSAWVDKNTGILKKEAGPYRLGYDARKELELTRVESKAHAHNRATRYMEKKLVRNLWRAWRELEP